MKTQNTTQTAASSVPAPRKVYLERKGDTFFVMFEDRAKGQRRSAAQFYKDEKGAVAWVNSDPSLVLVNSPHQQVKCVSGFYPTSDIACDFRLPHGGFCVDVTTTNNNKMETVTIAAFATKKEAMTFAEGLSMPWASWMKFAAPADSDTCTGVDAYALALAEHDAIEAECEAANQHWKSVGGTQKGPMGLTPDHIKATPEWSAAHTAYDKALRKLQRFNRGFLKQYKREWQATLIERRKAKSIGSALTHAVSAMECSRDFGGPNFDIAIEEGKKALSASPSWLPAPVGVSGQSVGR